jgi:hypothetical protein
LVSAVPDPMILPVIFNDDNNVDALETNKLVKLVLLNIDVDVACKFDIFNAEYVVKLLIDNIEFVDKLFTLVISAYRLAGFGDVD